MAKRKKFKGHDNVTKYYQRKLTDYQVMVRAEINRQNRLRNATEAENAFAEILKQIGIEYDREKIFQNGDRYILVDFYVAGSHIAFEIDGSVHDLQRGYDAGRDGWLQSQHIRTVRFSNKSVLHRSAEVAEKVREAIGS